MLRPTTINARIVNLAQNRIELATLYFENGRISEIAPLRKSASVQPGFVIPGFVDAHIHIESSMLIPTEFAAVALLHGTIATVSDPHEIANVCGWDGIEYMLQSAAASPLKFHFGAPSCVPATPMETSGAILDAAAVAKLLDDPRINHLSEVMNFPGVLARDPEVMRKIQAAQERQLPIDGHAPGLLGSVARDYFSQGISTDHECVSLEEAEQKIAAGAHIAIREGSAARNFDALWPLIDRFPEQCMFCSDDKHPDDLLAGHIDRLAARAVHNGCDTMNVLRVASQNAVQHYRLDVGQLRAGDPADFVIVEDLKEFRVLETYVDGNKVADAKGLQTKPARTNSVVNRFDRSTITAEDLTVTADTSQIGAQIRAIQVLDGQLLTKALLTTPRIVDGLATSDPQRDLLKLAVVNRYADRLPAVAFVQGFGMCAGAIASSVAHDSHNVVAVGASDEELTAAINRVIQLKGGLSLAYGKETHDLPLPVGGLMSTQPCSAVARQYAELEKRAKQLGSQLRAPFMSLSFLALPVIPDLKLTDQGLFDVNRFEFVSVFVK